MIAFLGFCFWFRGEVGGLLLWDLYYESCGLGKLTLLGVIAPSGLLVVFHMRGFEDRSGENCGGIAILTIECVGYVSVVVVYSCLVVMVWFNAE